MKLLAVSHTGQTSGAEQVLLDQLGHLTALGHDVVLAGGPGPLLQRAGALGVGVATLPELKPGNGRRALALAGLAAAHVRAAGPLRRLAADADLLLFNSALALPATLGIRLDKPAALAVHDVLIRSDRRTVLRAFSRVVDRAIAVSDAAAAYPISLGIDTRVVRNGARFPPLDPERAAATAASPPVVGINAALTPWKGHRFLFDAVAQLPGVRLEVLGRPFPGDGPYAAELVRRSEAPDLAGRVRFLGHRADVDAIMRRWSVSVSASVEPEAGPLVVLESLSLAIPVVATALGGTTEIVGDAALLVPPADPAALAEAIGAVLADPDLSMRLRRRGPEVIGAGLTLADSLAAMTSELEELAATRRPPAHRF